MKEMGMKNYLQVWANRKRRLWYSWHRISV